MAPAPPLKACIAGDTMLAPGVSLGKTDQKSEPRSWRHKHLARRQRVPKSQVEIVRRSATSSSTTMGKRFVPPASRAHCCCWVSPGWRLGLTLYRLLRRLACVNSNR